MERKDQRNPCYQHNLIDNEIGIDYYNYAGSLRWVVANVLDCDIRVSELELQPHYDVQLWTWKSINPSPMDGETGVQSRDES